MTEENTKAQDLNETGTEKPEVTGAEAESGGVTSALEQQSEQSVADPILDEA